MCQQWYTSKGCFDQDIVQEKRSYGYGMGQFGRFLLTSGVLSCTTRSTTLACLLNIYIPLLHSLASGLWYLNSTSLLQHSRSGCGENRTLHRDCAAKAFWPITRLFLLFYASQTAHWVQNIFKDVKNAILHTNSVIGAGFRFWNNCDVELALFSL